jgi:hypothetical protein
MTDSCAHVINDGEKKMTMNHARLAAAVTALVITTACGTSAKPDPQPTKSVSPVSVEVSPLDTFVEGTPGYVGLNVINSGPARQVTVNLRFTPGSGRTLSVERPLEGTNRRWTKVPLTTRQAALTGSFRTSLSRGAYLLSFRLTPGFTPTTEGDKVPVRVSLTAGGRTLATDDSDLALATLTTTLTSPKGNPPTIRRDGRWAEITFTVTNHSHRDYPKVEVQGYFTDCNGDNPVLPCDDPYPRTYLTSHFTTQLHDASTWKTLVAFGGAGTDGSREDETLPIATFALPAGTSKQVRLRIAPTSALTAKTTEVALTVRSYGLATGASERSLGTAGSTDLDVR